MSFQDLSTVESQTLAIIMGGGAGTRLYPLTKDRSKPAVPLAGKYRIVDIPISNCINSGLRHIYVLTQFNSASLHRHIASSYKFDRFSRSFVEILAAQQTLQGGQWYQGTADAVRKNLTDFLHRPYKYFIILSGDQLYRMDYRRLVSDHIAKKADITLCTIPVTREAAKSFGIMHSDNEKRVIRFDEKPQTDELLDELNIPGALLKELGRDPGEQLYQASMGIYVFNRDVLEKCLDNDLVDFGKHIIPGAIDKYKVQVDIFDGYWEDIGTIRAFFDANLDLTNDLPPFSFFDSTAPIYTHARFLPASKINGATIRNAVVSDGCIITNATLERCLIGVRGYVDSGTTLKNVVHMGADFYDVDQANRNPDGPNLGIGKNCYINTAIIDKNACIGDGVVITPEGKPEEMDGENFFVRDGIVVIPKNAVIPSGTRI